MKKYTYSASTNMGTYTYLHTYRFISDALRRCPLLWINRLGWISFGRWFSSIDTFIDLFTTRFWKSILESCHENGEPHFKPDLVSARYDTLGGLRSIMKIDTRDFSRPGQDSSDLHFVNAGIYIKNHFYLFYRKQRIVKIASIDRIAASDTFWHIMWLGGVK